MFIVSKLFPVCQPVPPTTSFRDTTVSPSNNTVAALDCGTKRCERNVSQDERPYWVWMPLPGDGVLKLDGQNTMRSPWEQFDVKAGIPGERLPPRTAPAGKGYRQWRHPRKKVTANGGVPPDKFTA